MRDPDETVVSDETGPRLRYERVGEGEVVCLRLEGTIDEQFDGAALLSEVGAGPLLLNLGGIGKISSFGIREWVDFMAQAGRRASAIYLIECSPKVIDQLNMVANFAGAARVVSFFAPYRCDYCDDERRRLLQVELDRAMIHAARMPDRICESCGNAEYFDEDPLTFFSHLQQQPPLSLPPAVEAFLAARSEFAAAAAHRKIKLEKLIEGRSTFVRISGDLDAEFPCDKLAEGLEGEVIFDLGGLGKIDPAGAIQWRRLLAAINPTVEKIRLIGCPPAFLERLGAPNDLGQKIEVLSFLLPCNCAECRRASARMIEVAEHFATLRFATPPELSCSDCGKPLECAASELLLSHVAGLPEPRLDEEARAQIARFQAELSGRHAPSAPSASLPALAPSPPVRPDSAPSGRPFILAAAFSALAVTVAITTFALVATRLWRDPPTPVGDSRPTASPPAAPAWIATPFAREGNRQLFVGEGESVGDEAKALERADEAALDALAARLADEGTPEFVTKVAPLFRPTRERLLGELARARAVGDAGEIERVRGPVDEARRRVAVALRSPSAGMVPETRSDLYWQRSSSPRGIHVRAFSRWAISDGQWRRLCERYFTVEEVAGARAMNWFPSLGWRFDAVEGAVVIEVPGTSPLAAAGVQAGDVVRSALDRTVRDAPSWKRLVEEETARLSPTGGELALEVQRGDAAPFAATLRIGRSRSNDGNKVAPVRRPMGARERVRPPSPMEKIHGNIWDDNPEE